MNGTSTTAFSPSATMSRGMLMTVLARYAGESTEGGTVWYEKGMNWAKNKGISDGSAPNRNITREQLAVSRTARQTCPPTRTQARFPRMRKRRCSGASRTVS